MENRTYQEQTWHNDMFVSNKELKSVRISPSQYAQVLSDNHRQYTLTVQT